MISRITTLNRIVILCFIWAINAVSATFTITVNAGSTWGNLPHFWSQCHGVGRLGLLESDTLQRHIADAVANLGVKMVRCHAGVSDARIYSENNGLPAYSWTRSDSLYDIFVRKLKVLPFVELAWIPEDMQTTGYSICPGPYCPPKDYTKWKNFIYECVNHWKQRYGASEIEKWRFETWNEAEWFGFYGNPGPPSLEENYKIQANSTWGALLADSNITIGGPATSSYDYEVNKSGAYLDYCGQNNVRVDFLSYHAYHDFPKTVEGHFWALNTMATYNEKYPKLHLVESSNTEYGVTWQFNLDPEPAETEYGATFVADIMSQIARRCHAESKPFPFMYSYWVISDVFDEGTYRFEYPFIGCMGYISRQNIHKPAYNTFKMLNKLGTVFAPITTNPASGTVNGLAAKDTMGGVQLLVYNADYSGNTSNDEVKITINGIKTSSGKVNYRCYLMDKTHSNSYQTWKTMGSPKISNMSSANWTTLRNSMQLQTVDSAENMQLTNNEFTKNISLAKQGVMLITLTPVKTSGVQTPLQLQLAKQVVRPQIVYNDGNLFLSFVLKEKGNVAISFYNTAGKRVKSFAPSFEDAGICSRELDIDATSGIYFYEIRLDNINHSGKITLY